MGLRQSCAPAASERVSRPCTSDSALPRIHLTDFDQGNATLSLGSHSDDEFRSFNASPVSLGATTHTTASGYTSVQSSLADSRPQSSVSGRSVLSLLTPPLSRHSQGSTDENGIRRNTFPQQLMDNFRKLSSASGKKRVSDFGDLAYLTENADGVVLTPRQKQLVKNGWQTVVKKGSKEPGSWIFLKIFSNHPEIKRIFRFDAKMTDKELLEDKRFQKHAQLFTDLLQMITESLDALDDSLGPLLYSYGSKHVNFEQEHGFRPELWECFADAMCEYPNTWKLRSHKAETLQAWRILVFFVVHKIKQGFELEKKRVTSHSRSGDL